ncbi:hypothetical protein Tco_0567640 [Tanacetum coccineum]
MIYVNNLKTDSKKDNVKAGIPSFPPPKPNPQHVDEFDLNDETSLSEYDEEKQNVLYLNDIFPFNIIHPDDLKSEKDNDDNDIDIIRSSEDNKITHGSNVLSETRSFVIT